MPQTIEALEELLLSLLRGEHSNLSIQLNDENAPNYQTVEHWLANCPFKWRTDWISEESKARGIATNRMWTAHWYPDTPIGSYRIAAATLTELIEHLAAHKDEYR